VLPSSMTIAWRVLVDRLPTRVNLEKKWIILESSMIVLESNLSRLNFIEDKHLLEVHVHCCGWGNLERVASCV